MKIEEIDFLKKVGKAIKEARRIKKIKQYQLAQAIGINPTHYNEIENGKKPMSILDLWKIMGVLGDILPPNDNLKVMQNKEKIYTDW